MILIADFNPMSEQLLAKLSPYIVMVVVSIICGYLYFTHDDDGIYFIPLVVMHLKFQWGLYVYDRKYDTQNTPPSCWTKCQYVFFKFI
jgi:hypothetical protein